MKTGLSILGALAIATSAQAQDFYAGGALDYAYPHSGDSQLVGSVIGGLALSNNPDLNYGAEAELGWHLAGDADYGTQRLRLWGTYDIGNVRARVAGGLTYYDIPGGDANGTNLGVGVERDFSPNVTLRGEFIRDFMDDTFTAAVTTTRIGVLYHF